MPKRNADKTFMPTKNQLIIFNELVCILEPYAKLMKVRKKVELSRIKPGDYEVWADEANVISDRKKKHNGVLFAGVSVRKNNVIGFYFFPLHVNRNLKENLAGYELEKHLHGASAFHFTELPEKVKDEIRSLLDLGVKCYRNLHWL